MVEQKRFISALQEVILRLSPAFEVIQCVSQSVWAWQTRTVIFRYFNMAYFVTVHYIYPISMTNDMAVTNDKKEALYII